MSLSAAPIPGAPRLEWEGMGTDDGYAVEGELFRFNCSGNVGFPAGALSVAIERDRLSGGRYSQLSTPIPVVSRHTSQLPNGIL